MNIFEIIRTANHNLLRNKARTILTIVAIFIGSFTICLNSAIHTGVNNFINEQTDSLGGEDSITIFPAASVNTMNSVMMNSGEPVEYTENQNLSAMTEEQLEELKSIDGIDGDSIYNAVKQANVEYVTSDYTEKKYTITVGGMPPGNFRIALAAGRLPEDGTDAYEITLQPGYAKVLGLGSDEDAVGRTVELVVKNRITNIETSFAATVVGVQARSVVLVNGAVISHALEDALVEASTAGYPEEMKNIVYMVQARFDAEKYTESEIKDILEEHGFYGATISDMMGAIRSFFDVIMVVFTIFGGIALLAAAIGIINTLLMSVEERTREIGLDKALGMSSGKIFLSFSVEAISLGFWGSAVGVGAAMLIGYVANIFLHQPGQFLEVFPTFNLFTFTLENMLPIIIVVMVIAFIAGTVPAWKAAHKNPIDALRYE